MLSKAVQLVQEAIANGVFPGACFAVFDQGVLHTHALGRQTYCPESPEVNVDTLWDLASVSKVVGTTTAAMLLYEDDRLKLDQPISELLPEFGQNGKESITVQNLLVHDSGLVAFRPYHKRYTKSEAVLHAIYSEGLEYPTGSKSVYSDLSMIVLGKAIEKLTELPLDQYLQERVFQPLGMNSTLFSPGELWAKCAPTEVVEEWRKVLRKLRYGLVGSRTKFGADPEFIQGEVHDPTATVLGGVAGHAGLFSAIGDLSKFMQRLTNAEIVNRETLALFTRRQNKQSSRALGWDTKSEKSSSGNHFGPLSYGHTGYTGTSIWCDPEANRFVILLSNRVHPTSDNTKIIEFRPIFHDAVIESL